MGEKKGYDLKNLTMTVADFYGSSQVKASTFPKTGDWTEFDALA